MTKLEQVTRSRAWKGATIEDTGAVYVIRHPSGAVARLFKEAARVQGNHWLAYTEAKRAVRELERPMYRTNTKADVVRLEKIIERCKKLTGLDVALVDPLS